MVLSLDGWLSGISAILVVISDLIIGLVCIYKSRKINARLLFYAGLVILCLSLPLSAEVIDFLTILATGNNMDNTYGAHGLLVWSWTPLLGLLTVYLATELLDFKKKEISSFYDVSNSYFC